MRCYRRLRGTCPSLQCIGAQTSVPVHFQDVDDYTTTKLTQKSDFTISQTLTLHIISESKGKAH